MKSGALILGIIVSAALLTAAGVLYPMAGGSSAQPYRASLDLVRRTEQLSSSWSVEVARVKADPLADFDSLAAFIPRMARLNETLADTARGIADLPVRLANDVQVYLNALAAKEERIERFKTGYAVVRNSRRFLPIAVANVARQGEELDHPTLARTVPMLIQDVNLNLATATAEGKERLSTDMAALREDSVTYPNRPDCTQRGEDAGDDPSRAPDHPAVTLNARDRQTRAGEVRRPGPPGALPDGYAGRARSLPHHVLHTRLPAM